MATAFAVYCADDASLNFYKRDSVPNAGSDFEGKVATNVYTGFEETKYTSYSSVPWYNNRSNITNVTFVDTITPISTACWFYDCQALTALDLSNFDTSNVTDMHNMFYADQALATLDLSSFDTSNVTDME